MNVPIALLFGSSSAQFVSTNDSKQESHGNEQAEVDEQENQLSQQVAYRSREQNKAQKNQSERLRADDGTAADNRGGHEAASGPFKRRGGKPDNSRNACRKNQRELS